MMHGYLCGPKIYEFEGITFENGYCGPYRLKIDGEPYARQGAKIYALIKQFEALPIEEQEKYRIGGGCMRFDDGR